MIYQADVSMGTASPKRREKVVDVDAEVEVSDNEDLNGDDEKETAVRGSPFARGNSKTTIISIVEHLSKLWR